MAFKGRAPWISRPQFPRLQKAAKTEPSPAVGGKRNGKPNNGETTGI